MYFIKKLLIILCFMPVLSSADEKMREKFKIPVEKYSLDNGLRVLLNPDDKLNTAYYILGIATGSRHERPGITGISHMFEHFMLKGTSKYPDFNKLYADNGLVAVNAFTSRDYTAYVASFPPEKLELILDVESDRMSNLTFTQEKLDKERGAVQEERLLVVDNNPQGFLFENMMDLLFKKHPYRWPLIGYPQDIANYSLEDLRSWYKTYYSPNNAVLVISGKFSVPKAKKMIQKYFGGLKRKEIPKEIKVVEPEDPKPRSRRLKKKVQAPIVMLAYVGPPAGHPEAYALEFIDHIMGSGESSVLYKKMVRENKMLSSISTGVYDFSEYNVFVVGYSLLDSSKEEPVKQIVLDELKKGLDRSLSERYIERVKNKKLMDLVSSLKKSSWRARMLMDYEINFNDYQKMYEELDWLYKMTPELIQKTRDRYLDPDKLRYIVLEP